MDTVHIYYVPTNVLEESSVKILYSNNKSTLILKNARCFEM